MAELAERFPARGFDKLFQIIHRRDLPWNHKRVWRVYCQMQLNRRRRGKNRVPKRHPVPLIAGLAVEIDLNLPASRVIRTLDRVAAWRGYPSKLRLDNGPEFVALALAEWAERKGIKLDFIEPGRLMQNGFIERFNGSFRRGVLDMHVFRNLTEVCEQAELWLADYNREIPHDSLGGLTPAEFRQQHDPATSGYGWH